MFLKGNTLNGKEKKTFRLHLAYALLEAILTGVFVLNEFVFLKSLSGSNYQLGVLFQFSTLVLLVAIFTNEILSQIKNKKKLLRIVAVATRFPLLFFIFFPKDAGVISSSPIYHYFFLFSFLVYFMASPIVLPTINLFLKNNYRNHNFGRLYSFVTTAAKITLLVVTFLFGLLLDYDNYAFRYVYPLVAVLGIISIFIFSKIDFEYTVVETRFSLSNIIKKALRTLSRTLLDNKPFRDYQISFMFYGFAFMGTVTVITIFYQVVLELNYTSVAFYKNSYNILAILLLPFFGKVIGKIDPRYFAIISFASLMFYIASVMLTAYYPYYTIVWDIKIYGLLMLGVLFHAFFAATMALLWSIGSAYFCKNEEAGIYQSVHLTLTGFRAIFMPLVGVLLYETFGFTATFILAIISLLLGIGVLYFSKKRHS